jgi:hypothetical protein
MTQEEIRLSESAARKKHWKRWGLYLSERPGGRSARITVPTGILGNIFPTIMFAGLSLERRRTWGICDRHQLICFALALWNECDPILKERLFLRSSSLSHLNQIDVLQLMPLGSAYHWAGA